MSLTDSQLAFDREHIWHPYTNLKNPTPVFGVESAEGVYLNLTNGQKVVDGMASWWSAIHGYNHPFLNQAIEKQTKKMSHVMFGGLTHEPAIKLSQTLVNITAAKLDCVFLADSGSVAVEVALKMALQFWYSQARPEKNKFLTVRNGYHGDTFGAMSVCDPENGMHAMFAGVLPSHIFVDAPGCKDDDSWNDEDIAQLKSTVAARHTEIAAIILEPIVQGAGGMRVYAPEYLRQVRQICDEYGVLLILDEIATGFGRTGSLFAYEQAQIVPDILCLGKAITGGYMSLAATLTTQNVAQTISRFGGGNLMHGPTFMGNPLACAIANASIELLLASPWQKNVLAIETQLEAELRPLESLPSVHEVRVKGAVGVVEMVQTLDMHTIQPRLVELGVWIRPFGKLLYIMPAYCMPSDELSKLTRAMLTIAEESI
ncbi:adenosylmethionine--8-amino-7-oxononanoate transaminase [Aliikangiella marina]|uniref:Adenosylmethionine-8-amino-7-oxononanoate aminotransferase n=1 Tax=Aliikangiella marina TaxID=1712262 RepID=A0A545TGZ9_9GAMM|nr:adenosylmethionine--8-amino-7-oxononanoate transaminase [Aliikangiella marina]TQV76510.1 adenosylmethionine--8-amino-7-oxononanoate transaminase [Aliikangiella marina]